MVIGRKKFYPKTFGSKAVQYALRHGATVFVVL